MSASGSSGRTLVIGYGNPARGDDGLGPALIERLGALALPGVETRSDYQLRVEDALEIGNFEQVIFVDAALDERSPFHHYSLNGAAPPAVLDTHQLSAQALMHLARTLFGASTAASMLAIRGYQFEPFCESLSERAEQNLKAALDYLVSELQTDLQR